jgi:hypothetical protein
MQSAGGRPADARPGARAPFKCCRGRAEEAEVVAFSSKLSPSSGKVVTLLNQLVPFGITSGSYNCTGHSDGDFKCKWFGDAATGPKAGRGCKGHGVYDRSKHRWKIDSCRP